MGRSGTFLSFPQKRESRILDLLCNFRVEQRAGSPPTQGTTEDPSNLSFLRRRESDMASVFSVALTPPYRLLTFRFPDL